MECVYPIWLGSEKVGKVTVEPMGLYLHFSCRCQLRSEVMCRVMVSCTGFNESLGILMPAGDDYILTKKLPIKHFQTGIPEFWITSKKLQMREIYIDIYPEEPFHYITKLENAYLDKRRDRPGVRFTEQI